MRIAGELGISRRTVNYWETRAVEVGDPVPWLEPAKIPSWYGRVHQGRALPKKVMTTLLGGNQQNSKKEEVRTGKNGASAAPSSTKPEGAVPDYEGGLERLHVLLVTEMEHLETALKDRSDTLATRSNRDDLLKVADKIRQVSKGIAADLLSAGRLVDRGAAKDEFLSRLLELKKKYRQFFTEGRGRLLAAGCQREWEEMVDRICEDAEVAFAEGGE
jgi:hypothetical protein